MDVDEQGDEQATPAAPAPRITYHDQVVRNPASHGRSDSAMSTGTVTVRAFISPNVVLKLRTIPGLNASDERALS
jgi:hypothetical protein